MATKTITLSTHGIVIRLDEMRYSGGALIQSELHTSGESAAFTAALDAIESFLLALAVAGVDVEQPAVLEALETALDAIANHVE